MPFTEEEGEGYIARKWQSLLATKLLFSHTTLEAPDLDVLGAKPGICELAWDLDTLLPLIKGENALRVKECNRLFPLLACESLRSETIAYSTDAT